jgi:Xaa-Pro aminopeptidase
MLLNLERAIDYMRNYELDALVATSPANVTYFTDYASWLEPIFRDYMMDPGGSSSIREGYAVLPAEGEPAIVLNPEFAVNAADLWVKDIQIYGNSGLDFSLPPSAMTDDTHRKFYELARTAGRHRTPTEALAWILQDRGLTDARIGIELEGLDKKQRDAIQESMPKASIKDCTNLLRLIRMVKSAEEQDRLRRSADISERALMESLKLAKTGTPVSELSQRFRGRIADEGADFDHYAFCYRGLGLATEPHYVLSDVDITYIDVGCIYKGYFSDTGLTLSMRELSKEMQNRYDLLRDCVAAGAAAMKPGAKASAPAMAMREAMESFGDVGFPHGHGVGIEVRDYPILVPNNGLRIKDEVVDVASDLPIEEGMILNLEAGLICAGAGSFQVEQTFLIDSDGAKPIVEQDRSRPIIPGAA